MSRRNKEGSARTGNAFQFTLTGLIIFSLVLIAGASFITFKLTKETRPKAEDTFAVDPNDKTRSVHDGPWGELLMRDIQLERPAEYLGGEVANPPPETWTFGGLNREAVKALLGKNGLNAAQIDAVMKTAEEKDSGTVVKPSLEFLLSLNPETRGKLYTALQGMSVNLYLDYPFIFPNGSIDSIYADPQLNPDDVKLLKQLVYNNGAAQQFSDYNALLCQIPTVEGRVVLSRRLSRQSAVLARLIVKPDTDIDKIAAYWGKVPNVRFTDLRPLLESLKALPEGGNISLLYLMPKFARDGSGKV